MSRADTAGTWYRPCLEESVLRGADLDLAGADARVIARLGIDRRPALHVAAAQVEGGAVPRADHRVALALALVERPAHVGARRRDRADLVRLLRARDDDRLALELDSDESAAVELVLLADRCVAVARS